MDAAGLAAATIGSNLVSFGLNRQAEDRAYERNLALMERQNDFNVQMWNRTNMYNSPSNQVKLLQDAGLNPAIFSPGQSNASEVTAASAEVPYQQDAGAPLRDAVGHTIAALQADAQIEKLRTDIKYQRLLNEDYELRLKASKEGIPVELPEPIQYDENGNPVVTSSIRRMNKYDVDRYRDLQDLHGRVLSNEKSTEELEVYRDSKIWLKHLNKYQAKKLEEEFNRAVRENTILDNDVQLARQFGINPNDDGWKALIKIALRDPSAAGRIVSSLVNSIRSSGQYIWDNFNLDSWRNPSSPQGSW